MCHCSNDIDREFCAHCDGDSVFGSFRRNSLLCSHRLQASPPPPPRYPSIVITSGDCFIHDPTPRRGPPPTSRPNRLHPIPLQTPSPPPTLATYDQNVGDGQLPTARRKKICLNIKGSDALPKSRSVNASAWGGRLMSSCASLALLRIIFRRLR